MNIREMFRQVQTPKQQVDTVFEVKPEENVATKIVTENPIIQNKTEIDVTPKELDWDDIIISENDNNTDIVEEEIKQEDSETKEKVEDDLNKEKVEEVDNRIETEAEVEELPAPKEEILPIITSVPQFKNTSIMLADTIAPEISDEELQELETKANEYENLKTELESVKETIITQNKETDLLKEYINMLLDYAKVSKEELIKAQEQKQTLEQYTGRTIITL